MSRGVKVAFITNNKNIINNNMPNQDGTGPMGQGPRTGRGYGPCGDGARSGAGRGFFGRCCGGRFGLGRFFRSSKNQM